MTGKRKAIVHLLNAYTWAGRRAECSVTSEGLNCTSRSEDVTCLECIAAASMTVQA